MIPYGRQSISEEDIDAVVRVLRSDFLTQGPMVERFEQALADYCGAKYAVAVSSGTAALHVACLAAGLGPGDVLWTTPNTFVASANCGRYCGADVDFVDIDPLAYCMSADRLAEKLETAKRLPKVVVPVDFAGQSCEMDAIHLLAGHYGFTVIEDAAHALGGTYLSSRAGACEFSDMATLSFHPVKSITTGEGGAVTTNDARLAEKLRMARSHGITRRARWYYDQQSLGYNYRLSDIHAALGLSQLARLDAFVSRRRELAARYDEALRDLPLVTPYQDTRGASAWHLYVVRVPNRCDVYDSLREAGIGVNVHYIPVHLQPYYRAQGFAWGDFPAAESYYEEALTLPLFADMTDDEQDQVAEAIGKALGH